MYHYGKVDNKDACGPGRGYSHSRLRFETTRFSSNTLELIITPVIVSVITDVTVESLLTDLLLMECYLKLPKQRPARKRITYRKHGAIDNALFECDLLGSSLVSAAVNNTQTQSEQIHQ